MDLYFQIGLLFVLAAAFAMFISIVVRPNDGMNIFLEYQQEATVSQVEKFFEKDVKPFFNNPSVSGTDVYSLIASAHDMGIAVLVQTRIQNGLIVNYGYQLRNSGADFNSMNPVGYYRDADLDGNAIGDDVEPIDFENRYVTSAKAVFSGAPLNSKQKQWGLGAHLNLFVPGETYTLENAVARIKNPSRDDYHPHSKVKLGDEFSKIGAPRLFTFNPILKEKVAYSSQGENYSAAGVLYTESVLSSGVYNKDYPLTLRTGSLYYLDQNSKYYTTHIYNTTGDLVGVYVEEHGVVISSNILATLMVDAGIIDKVY